MTVIPLWPLAKVEPKPMDRSRLNSISKVLMQNISAVFYFSPKAAIQGGREISVIIVTNDYLYYKEPKSLSTVFLF